MKDFLKNYKMPLILGGCAIIVIIATVIIVSGLGGGGSYGLYISSAGGSVSVTSSDNVRNSSGGDQLKNGDILTVGEDSSCTLTYSGKKNSDNNYLVVGAGSQIVVSGDFDGKQDGELFLRKGTVIGNFAGEDKCSVKIRTAEAMITTGNSVSKISYSVNEFMSYTDLYTFMGDNTIWLYDSMGNIVPVYDNSGEPIESQKQIERRWGRVVPSSEDGEEDIPEFKALNLEFDLEELTAFDLKQLITIAAIVGDDFPYSAEELKTAYDAKAENEPEETDVPEETSADVTEGTDRSDDIQTAEPIVTTPPPTETTLPGQTTYAPATTTASTTTTEAPVTETTTTTGGDVTYHTVTIVVDGEETIQEVAHGADAVKPEDPVIDGMEFQGWDGSFENVTEDRTITALFIEEGGEDTPGTTETASGNTHTVTVVIGNRSTTLTVEHGQSANLPSDVTVEGYIFMGWDKDFSNITEDITITAVLEPVSAHTVTFVVEGTSYQVTVEHGGTAVPTYIPGTDSNGNRFVGWDRSLDNITADTTITAVFAAGEYHTVTFIIDGQSYTVRVADGETAEPPFWPVNDSAGNRFLGWDKSIDNIKSDVTVTALFG